VAVWKSCAERDPERYGPHYRNELSALRQWLNQAGRQEEAILLDLDTDTTG
jgi:hypothetical protein